MKQGGNAFDAACAISLVLGVVEPYHSGIGGGCFHVFYDKKSDSFHAVDARGVAPKNAYQDMFLDENGDVRNCTVTSSGRLVGPTKEEQAQFEAEQRAKRARRVKYIQILEENALRKKIREQENMRAVMGLPARSALSYTRRISGIGFNGGNFRNI